MELFTDKPHKTLVLVTIGVIGMLYCIYHIYILFFRLIKFDRILNKGQFLLRVLNFVLLVPFVLLFCFHPKYAFNKNVEYSPKHMMYQKELYSYVKADVDTLSFGELREEYKSLPRYDTYEVRVDDSIVICKNNLPNKIIKHQSDPSLFWSLYVHYMDPGNQHMTTSQSGRKRAALTAILGYFLLNGLLVSTLISWFDRRKEKWTKGEVRYNCYLRFKPHYVIIGGSNIVVGIVQQILQKIDEEHSFTKPYILIQTSRDVESFRRELFSTLTPRQQQRIIIYYGSRDSKEDIADLELGSAKEVYLIGEETRTDDTESYHDTINMRSMELISAVTLKQRARKSLSGWLMRRRMQNSLVCRVMFEYQTTFNIVKVTDIDMDCIKFLPFNYYEMWAQHMLVCQKLEDDKSNAIDSYKPLEGYEGIKPTDSTFVHLVIVDMSRMGTAMAIEAAHLAHYPNFDTKKRRTRITFIDASMEQQRHFFMGRFKELFAVSRQRYIETPHEGCYDNFDTFSWVDPTKEPNAEYSCSHLGEDFVDVEWEFINASVENPHVQSYLASAAKNPDAKLTIAICIPDNSRAIAAATYMPDSVYSSDMTQQILVYQRRNNDLLKQIAYKNKRYNDKLRAFGMATECYDSSLVDISEFIGRKIGNKYNEVTNSKPSGKTEAAMKWSNTYNVYSMWTKFRCFGVDFTNRKDFDKSMLEAVANVEHNRWVVEQLLLRYRPLTLDQQNKAKTSHNTSTPMKSEYKKMYAHLDICSNDVLKRVDPDIVKLDKALVEILPAAYKEYLDSKTKHD